MTDKRQVLRYVRGMTERGLDRKLQDMLDVAGLMGDADAVIACLNESPRYKNHVVNAAKQRLEAKRAELNLKVREVEMAEMAVQQAMFTE